MSRRWMAFWLAASALFLVAATAIVTYAVALVVRSQRDASGIRERFDLLEFVTIHRPHLTYHVDSRHMLCFATRKPSTCRGLVQFDCPVTLLEQAQEREQEKVEPKTTSVVHAPRHP